MATDFGALTNAWALVSGVDVGPIKQFSGAFANAASILNKAVDVLVALSSGGAGNISVFVADNDTVTIGSAAKFEEIEFLLDTAASGAGIQPKFEFSTGVGTWTEFGPIDDTNGFRDTGVIAWLDSDIPTWAVGTGSEFLIRITRQRNTLTTTPILDQVEISAATVYEWDKDGGITASTMTLAERAEAVAIAAGEGQFWVDNTTPNIPMFTDDADTDWVINGDVTAAAAMTDNTLIKGDGGAKGVQDSGIVIDDSDNMSAINTIASGAATLTEAAGTTMFTRIATATNDDPTTQNVGNRATSTDAGSATLHTFDLSVVGTYQISVFVMARCTLAGGGGLTLGDSNGYWVRGTFKNVGGTITRVGSDSAVAQEDFAAGSCTLTISGTNVLVNVVGTASGTESPNTYVWHMNPVSHISGPMAT